MTTTKILRAIVAWAQADQHGILINNHLVWGFEVLAQEVMPDHVPLYSSRP